MTMPEPTWGKRAVRPIPFGPLTNAGVTLSGRGCYLAGWSLIETTGAAAAEVDIFDGHDATGVAVAFVSMTASQSTRESLAHPGIALESGLFVVVLAGGTAKGVLWVVEH